MFGGLLFFPALGKKFCNIFTPPKFRILGLGRPKAGQEKLSAVKFQHYTANSYSETIVEIQMNDYNQVCIAVFFQIPNYWKKSIHGINDIEMSDGNYLR